MATVKDPSSLIPATRVCTHSPVPAHQPVGRHAHQRLPLDNWALAELLFSLEGLWDLCYLVTAFSNLRGLLRIAWPSGYNQGSSPGTTSGIPVPSGALDESTTPDFGASTSPARQRPTCSDGPRKKAEQERRQSRLPRFSTATVTVGEREPRPAARATRSRANCGRGPGAHRGERERGRGRQAWHSRRGGGPKGRGQVRKPP